MEALRIIADSWPIAAMVMTLTVAGMVCWIVRRGTYNHECYLKLRDEHEATMNRLALFLRMQEAAAASAKAPNRD